MKNENVGPDTYDADKGFAKNNSPAYSMGNRSCVINSEWMSWLIGVASYSCSQTAETIDFKRSK